MPVLSETEMRARVMGTMSVSLPASEAVEECVERRNGMSGMMRTVQDVNVVCVQKRIISSLRISHYFTHTLIHEREHSPVTAVRRCAMGTSVWIPSVSL